ncbi:MAG: TRAP transporter substrate-binding protein DctP [Chloroflexi bacterium]|nr:TRAP transporter substrate-binding protein DctP [Chloroflexota bacterium]
MQDIAAKLAGGPGAFYLGDINQLVGPAPSKVEGDADGNVPLEPLRKHLYVYESDYYKGLIEKANFENPTKLVSEGQDIKIQHACVNRALVFCKIVESYFSPNLLERTNGQLNIVPTSFPELGISGPDTLSLVEDGTLDMVSILAVYVAGELPALEISALFGLYTSREDQYNATALLTPELTRIVEEASGAKLINSNWHNGDDIFLFTKKPLRGAADLVGLKVRSFGTAIADWIQGMGANAQFMAFSEVYTALERGIIDAGVTGGDAGHGQRWYEVTDYINGPLTSWPTSLNMMNKDVWDAIPADLQQILIEEGAKTELEALRLGSIQNELGLQKNIDSGLEFVEFNEEMRALSDAAVVDRIVPNWIKRVGGPDQPIVQVFNEIIGTIVGLRVEADGTVVRTSALASASTTPTVSAALQAYADAHAGGPGAVYAGDINQLVGPAPEPDLGDDDGNVPLWALQTHMYIYEGEYYQGLLERAKLANPTELVSSGESFKLQHACINRTLGQCKIIDSFWVNNIEERTNGQIELKITSFPELGIAGTDTISLVGEGTLGTVEIYSGYVAGELPEIEVMSLWGIWPDQRASYLSISSMHPELDVMISDATDGAVVVSHQWVDGVDQFLWSRKPLDTVEAFKGLKVRSHSAAMSDWIVGMGAQAQFVAFSEVYTALERGILDAGATGGGPGFGQRWYEVTDYINGPLPASLSVHVVVNKKVWDKIPADLQQIIIEEGAKTELEGLRVMAILDTQQFKRNVDAGLEFVQFPPEVVEHSFNEATIKQVIPAWIRRVGGPDTPIIALFNEKVGPYVGVKIESDGTVVIVPKTK